MIIVHEPHLEGAARYHSGMRLTPFFMSLAVLAAFGTTCVAVEPAKPELLESRKIWDAAPHNAFTDLIWFKDAWYCCFRE